MMKSPDEMPRARLAEVKPALRASGADSRCAAPPRPTSLILTQIVGKIRRLYLTTFRMRYVEGQALHRKGKCTQCGACCRFVYRCPYLTRDRLCGVYASRRPASCTRFPIDERDLREVPAGCGYRFTNRTAITSKRQ